MLEAKAEDKNPLVGKEQARKYARSLNCRFVILSNANRELIERFEKKIQAGGGRWSESVASACCPLQSGLFTPC